MPGSMKTPDTRAGGARGTVRVLDDLDAVTAAGRERFLAAAARAIRDHGVFRVALAGGSTPKKLYSELVGAPIDWSKVLVFFGDERCVPPAHADSNYRMAREAFLSKVVIPGTNVHRIYAESGDVHVFDVATGKERGDVVERVNGGTAGGSLTWTSDGAGFYYTRYPKKGERPAEDLDFYQQVWLDRKSVV